MNRIPTPNPDDLDGSGSHAPLHGDRGPDDATPRLPAGLCVAISREAGARGKTMGERVGRLLDWPVYSQDDLEALCHDSPMRDSFLADLTPAAILWAENRYTKLQAQGRVSDDADLAKLARVVLLLGSAGGMVFVGRAAGYLLPQDAVLHVRVIAPTADRIAAMRQWQRLTKEQAADYVREGDARRAEFLQKHFGLRPDDPVAFDLIVNSSRYGEELGAELIAHAARAKQLARDAVDSVT